MNRKTSILSILAAAVAVAAVGCAQQPQDVAKTSAQKKYYHDRSIGVGSNIPRSYSDSPTTSTSADGMSDANALEFQQMQRTLGNQGGISTGTGGR